MDRPTASHRALASPAWHGRWYAPLVAGAATALLLLVGLSGLADATSPQESAQETADLFVERRSDILLAAPFGWAGAAALVVFAVLVVRLLLTAGQHSAAIAVAIGAGITAAYHAGIQVVYTTLAYEIAAESPEATKALFVLTILGVPVLGAGVAAMLGGFAYGARAAGLVPAWMVALSALGAVVSCVALVSFAESDLFSPDVQQQIVGGIGTFWPLLAGAVLAWRGRRQLAGRTAV